MTNSLINTQITILTYLVFGFVLYKVKMIDDQSQLFISNLTINVLLPASVFVSFLNSLTFDLLKNLLIILILAAILETIIYIFTKIPIKYFSHSEACVNHYGMLVSNGGLVGTPVIESLFGSIGVMYCNVFMIPTRIMAYSAGESIFNPKLKRGIKDIIVSIVTNRIILVMILGFLFVYFNISLPAPVFTAISKISGCLSPMSLMLVGSMLAQNTDFNISLLKKVSIITLIRLIIIPLCALMLCVFINLDFQTTAVIVLLMGMPVGSTCASFSKKYKGNEKYATAAVIITTLLSTITLVGLMKIMEMLF